MLVGWLVVCLQLSSDWPMQTASCTVDSVWLMMCLSMQYSRLFSSCFCIVLPEFYVAAPTTVCKMERLVVAAIEEQVADGRPRDILEAKEPFRLVSEYFIGKVGFFCLYEPHSGSHLTGYVSPGCVCTCSAV